MHSVDDVYLEQEKTLIRQKRVLERVKKSLNSDTETRNKKAEGLHGFGSTKNYLKENPLYLYYVFEIAKKCLLNPISWVLRSDTMPQNIAIYKPSPKLLFMCCVACYESAISILNVVSSDIKLDKLNDDEANAMYYVLDKICSEGVMHETIANHIADILKDGHIPNIDFNLVEMNIYFQSEIDYAMGIPFDEILQDDSESELIKKIDEMKALMKRGFKETQIGFEEVIQETREIPRQINKNKAIDPDFAYIEALLEKPAMIEKKPYTEKYKIIETEKTGTSKKLWKKEAEQRFNKKGLCSKQCWDRLNKKYFVTKNGKPYKNIYSFLNSK